MRMENKRLIIIVITLITLLLIPFIAMQFTDEVNFTLLDFVVAGVLLLSTGLIGELLIRKVNKKNYRIAILIVLFIILIWVELAVGIFGTPFSGD